MKRDMDLVRRLLLLIEESTFPGMVEIHPGDNGFNSASPLYKHWGLLMEAGLIRGEVKSSGTSGENELYYMDADLTWKGHDFLDSVRDPEIWAKTKKGAESAKGFTFDLIADLAKGLIKKQIEEYTGVKL